MAKRKLNKSHRAGLKQKHHQPTTEVIFLIIILLISGYFLITQGGITGALVDISEASVDSAVVQQLKDSSEVAVIVLLHEPAESTGIALSINQQQEIISKAQEKVLDSLSLEEEEWLLGTRAQEFDLTYQYATINAFSGQVTAKGLKKLQQDYHVAKIRLDRQVNLLLDRSVPLINVPPFQVLSFNQTKFTGAGQTVCMVDTGISYTHSAFGNCSSGQVISGQCRIKGYNIAEDNADPLDQNGHGTHVAGIVAANDTVYSGVVPGANIAAVKVFPGSSGTTTEAMVIAGIDWCIANAANLSISVISLSLGDGSSNNQSCDASSLGMAVNNAADAGILVSVASGNSGYADGLSSPACASKALSVGSTTKSDLIASYSNSAKILDVLAPGSSIISASTNGNFASRTGTSMSAPHAAGAAVLIKQYFSAVHNQILTPADIELRLKKGVAIADNRNSLIFPRIDLYLALKPEIMVTAPENNLSIKKNSLSMEIQSDVALSEALLELDGANLTMNRINSTFYSFNITNASTGTHYYRIYASDLAGTTAVGKTLQFTVQAAFPSVSFNFADRVAKEGIVIINVTASAVEGRQISAVNFTVNSSIVNNSLVTGSNNSFSLTGINDSSNYWMASLNLSSLAEGSWVITAAAIDDQGNSNATEFRTITIDRTAPLIANVTNSGGPLLVNSTIEITATVSDPNLAAVLVSSSHTGQLVNYTLSPENGTGLVGSKYIYRMNTSVIPGNHLYQIQALDSVFNAANSSSLSLVISNRDPENVLITVPSNGSSFTTGTVITFSGSASDPDGQQLSYSWRFGDGQTAAWPSVTHSYESKNNYTIILTISDGVDETDAQLSLQITELISDDSNGTPGSSSGSTSGSSSSGASGGGSSSSSASSDSQVVSKQDAEDENIVEDIESLESAADINTAESELAADTIELAPPEAALSEQPNRRFSLNLVGAAVGDFITTQKAASIGILFSLGLLLSAIVIYIVVRKRHQSEMYGLEAVKAVRQEQQWSLKLR